MKRAVRLLLAVGAIAAVVALVRRLRADQDPLPAPPVVPSSTPWPPLPDPDGEAAPSPGAAVSSEPSTPPEATPQADPAADPGWRPATDDGACPDGYPIKAKDSSQIFHAPGQRNYDRTTPDRCYVSTEAAEADGYRPSKI